MANSADLDQLASSAKTVGCHEMILHKNSTSTKSEGTNEEQVRQKYCLGSCVDI